MFKLFLSIILLFSFSVMASTYIKGPALIEDVTSTATAAGTTTLTKDSQTNQVFTGVSTQTVVLPNATTLPTGRRFYIENQSTGSLTIRNATPTTIDTIAAGNSIALRLVDNSSAAGSWAIETNLSVVDLATDVAGILPIANGGTNNSTAYTAGSVIYSNGTSLTQDNTNLFYDAANTALKIKGSQIQIGTLDAFSRPQIWNYATNSILRLGSLASDGDATTVPSEGIVVYDGNIQGDPMSSTNFSYARIKPLRFGLYNSYSGGAEYFFKVDPTSLYLTNDSFAKTFEITRTTGQIDTAMSTGVIHSDASGILSSSAVNLASADVTGTLPIANGGTNNSSAYTAGSIIFSNGTSLTQDNSNLFWDDTNNYLGLFTATPSHSVHVQLPATSNFFVDARTNPRTITQGVVRVEHTPAITGTRAFNIDIDINGFADTHSMVVDYALNGLSAGQFANNILVNYDTGTATGGEAHALHINKSGSGTAEVWGVHASGDVNLLEQTQGALSTIEQAFTYNGAYTDTTTAFSTNATNVTLFNTNLDYVYVGMAATYSSISVVLATAANTSVLPTFEYSIGGGSWTTFSPTDGTNGFTKTGVISWSISGLSGWATDTVNAVGSKYWIRIQRTKPSVTTKPIESVVKVQQGNRFYWDKNGDVVVNSISLSTPLAMASGGTNKNMTASAGSVAYSDANSLELTSVGTSGQALVSGGTGAPTWFAPTAGSVLFAGTGGILAQDNANLFWDDSNNRLGIGTASPGSALDVKGTLRLSGATSGYVGFAPAAAAGSTTYTLPTADGSINQALVTDGAGTLSWSSRIATQGTRQTGTSISASTQITPIVGVKNTIFVAGNGGAVIVTQATPFVTTNMVVGQEMTVCGTSDANSVTYNNGNNLVLNGSAQLGKDQCIGLEYAGSDGTNSSWVETRRNF